MAENSSSPAGGQAPQPGDQKQPQLRILGQYIKDLSFESPNAPAALRDPGSDPNIHIDVNVNASQIEPDIYESAIHMKVEAKSAKFVIYNVELEYGGVFELKDFPPDVLQAILFVNCPSFLFPFVRRLIGDLTREGGFPPLWLEPIDWGRLLQQRIQQAQQNQQQPAGS
jgi:preprotein translocase subunit SecB